MPGPELILRDDPTGQPLQTGRPVRQDGRRMHWQLDEPPAHDQGWGDSWRDRDGVDRIRLSRGWVTEDQDAVALTLRAALAAWRTDRRRMAAGWREALRSPLVEDDSDGSWTRPADLEQPATSYRPLRRLHPHDIDWLLLAAILAVVIAALVVIG